MRSEGARLIVRGDDFGLSHYQNIGIEKSVVEGIVTSVSIMSVATQVVPSKPGESGGDLVLGEGDGFEEAVEICKKHPEFNVGVHLTLDQLKPVLPKEKIPSLVNEDGYMSRSKEEFLNRNPRPEEVEKEERAQIERVLNAGIDVTYIDAHDGLALATPELFEVLKKLAIEYNVPISARAGDKWTLPPELSNIVPEQKLDAFISILEGLESRLWVFMTHPTASTEEMKNVEWWGKNGGNMFSHVKAELEVLTSPIVKKVIEKRGIELVGYRTIRDEIREKGGYGKDGWPEIVKIL